MPARSLLPAILPALLLMPAPVGAQDVALAAASQAPSLPASAEDAALLAEVQRLLAEGPAGTRYGLLVETAERTPVLAIAPDQRFIPASNTKVFTTVAAYAELATLQEAAEGTGVRLEPAGGGVFDVVLEGRGDAALSAAADCTDNCLATLADAVAARTRSVRDVIGDDSWYPDQRWSPGMSWNNIPTRSGTGISALSIDDNETALEARPAEPGRPPTVAGNGYYEIVNRAMTVPGAEAALSTWRMPGSHEVEVSGSIGAEANPATLRLGIDDPAHYAAWHMRRMLAARGVAIRGDVLARHRPLAPDDDPQIRGGAPAAHPPEEQMLAQLGPQDLAEDVRLINKVSQNVHAELLLRRVGRLAGSGSLADGQAALRLVTARAGVAEDGWVLADGSGMSTYNRISPRAMVALLHWVAAQDWGPAFRGTLPIGGVDGTITTRFKETPLEGQVFAKTGSVNASRALSGYLTAASGRTLVFSAFANDIPPGAESEAIAAYDAALVAVAAAN